MSQPRIAIVGGGIAGTLCSLVLKNRGLQPILIDGGRNGMGGRLRRGGAQFWRATDARLMPVLAMLEREGMLAKWTGRFGLLGSKGGGFLPSEFVTSGLAGTNEKDNQDPTASQIIAATDGGDFCQFVDGSKITNYVGTPSMDDICPEICRLADIDEINNVKVTSASASPGGGWKLKIENGGKSSRLNDEDYTFDALVLATQDPSLASRIVQSIVNDEVQAGGHATVKDAIEADNTSDELSLVLKRLVDLARSLQMIRDQGRLPVYSLSCTYPPGFSNAIPFDAVSVPGSHTVQFLAREASKPGNYVGNHNENSNVKGDIWTAISTSRLAQDVLSRLDLTFDDQLALVANTMTLELAHLLAPYHGRKMPTPLDVSVRRWGAAFCGRGLDSKDDSIILAPWRLAVCGDFIRTRATPLEAAALSGLEAGERTAALFTSQIDSPSQ